MSKIHLLLYVASIVTLIGFALLAAYEGLALGGWNKWPTITTLLRPWIQHHEPWTYAFIALGIIALVFFIYHFYVDIS